jgi:hypothetical protein
MVLAGRPVNIQATRSIVMQLRGDLLGQPYLTLVQPAAEDSGEASSESAEDFTRSNSSSQGGS